MSLLGSGREVGHSVRMSATRSWDLGYWVQEQLKEIRRRLLSWFSQHANGIEDRDHFKDIVPDQSFARSSPPRTASPILRRVPMSKYSANRSFNSGNLAIDFPVRISPTSDGHRTNIAVTTR